MVMLIHFTTVVVNPLGIQYFEKDVNPLLSFSSPFRDALMCSVEREPLFQPDSRCDVLLNQDSISNTSTDCQILEPGIFTSKCLFIHSCLVSVHMERIHVTPKGRFHQEHPCLCTRVPDIYVLLVHGSHSLTNCTQTVLSITHSELSNVGFSSSLSSYCSSMPFTDRLRLVQMLLILRGWLLRHCDAPT